MHVPRLGPVVLLAALAAAAPAGAGPGFDGNVCRLVSAKQVAPLTGSPSRCTTSPATKGPGSTIFVGTWAGRAATSPRLQVTVALYSDPGALALAKRNLRQGLPGAPKKVTGIGTGAYEASGAGAAGIHFTVGKDVASLTLTPAGKERSLASLETLARTIAARL